MTIASEINDLKTNLVSAKEAIEAAGGTVSNTGLAGLTASIESIPSGGGDPYDGHGPISDVDKKYAEMEWTFEVDTMTFEQWGMESTLARCLKLNGEYVYDFVQVQPQEEWEEPYWSRRLKEKFSDISQIQYLKPISMNLESILNALRDANVSVSISGLQSSIDFSEIRNLKEFPEISFTDSDPESVLSQYGWFTLPGSFFSFNETHSYGGDVDFSKMLGNSTLIRLTDKINRYHMVCGGAGTSSSNPISFSSENAPHLTKLTIYPKHSYGESNRTIYFGELGNISELTVNPDDYQTYPTTVFSEAEYQNITRVRGIVPDLTRFPNINDLGYALSSTASFPRRYVGNISIALPRSNPLHMEDAFSAVEGTLTLTGGGRSMVGAICPDSNVTSVDMSGMNAWPAFDSTWNIGSSFRNCYRLRTVRFPAYVAGSSVFSPSSDIFQGCFALSTLDLSLLSSANAQKLANNYMGDDVPKNCAITVIDQAAADAFTAKGFTNVTVAS